MNETENSPTTSDFEEKADEFANRLRDFCLLFRFYASVVLVIVGESENYSK